MAASSTKQVKEIMLPNELRDELAFYPKIPESCGTPQKHQSSPKNDKARPEASSLETNRLLTN
jgi:hypothetical protein